MVLLLFAMGFFLFGPDAMIVSASAVDFGTKKGAASSAGLINGMGSTGQILGLSLPGIIWAKYGWGVLFNCLGAFVCSVGGSSPTAKVECVACNCRKKTDSRVIQHNDMKLRKEKI